jgi:hypothetical protein
MKNKKKEEQKNQYIEGSKRKRVQQSRKRAIKSQTLDPSQYGLKGIMAYWREKRRIPRAESRLDAILASISMVFGIILVVSIIFFFMGRWKFAKFSVILSFCGILIIAAIDSWNRKRLYSYLAIGGCIIAVLLIGWMIVFL